MPAFVDPDDIEAWHSIGDLTVEVHEFEPELGVSLSMTHAPGDDRFDFEGEFLEVVETERLVFTCRSSPGRTPMKSRVGSPNSSVLSARRLYGARSLEDEGWIAEAESVDGRERCLELTADGRQTVEAAYPAWKEAQDEVDQEFF